MLDTALALASQTLGTGVKSGALIHCTLTHGGVLKGLANALPSHHFLAPDLPNHGKSADWPSGKEGMQGAAASAIATMLDAPADVIGHSFGATVALRLAVMHPEKVRTLTLIEPVSGAVARVDEPEIAAAHEVEAMEMLAAIHAGDLAGAAYLFTRDWGLGRPWETIPEEARAKMAAQMPFVAASQAEIFDDTPGLLTSGALEGLAIPTLVLEGAETAKRHPVMRAICLGLARRIPGAKHALVEGAGHMAPLTHADAVAHLIRENLPGF
jgi:lipase